MFNSYKKFWENYVNFSGTSSRKDYWFAYLMNAIVTCVLGLIMAIEIIIIASRGTYERTSDGFDFVSTSSGVFLGILISVLLLFMLATIIPNLSITIRRLRDGGYHWAFIFLGLIPWVGSLALIVLLCMPTSEDNTNMFTSHKHASPDELEKWYKLKVEGVITQEEYDTKKKELL